MHNKILGGAALGLLALWFATTPARAVYLDGNELYSNCLREGTMFEAHCGGFITGVADAMGGLSPLQGLACIPENVTLAQLSDVVVKWLEDNPGQRHFTAVSLVASILTETFPC